jgi:hypothetical protein
MATPTWAISAKTCLGGNRPYFHPDEGAAAHTAFDTSSFPADTWTLSFLVLAFLAFLPAEK